MFALLLGAQNAYAQGAVQFNNLPNGRLVNGLTGSAVEAVDGIVAQLYWSDTEDGVFISTGSPTLVGEVLGTPLPGHFYGGCQVIPGISPDGGWAYFEVRAWESSYGGTFEEAVAAGPMNDRIALRGISSRLYVKTGKIGGLPDVPTDLGALIPPFSVNVPEPSVAALVLLYGGACLIAFQRSSGRTKRASEPGPAPRGGRFGNLSRSGVPEVSAAPGPGRSTHR